MTTGYIPRPDADFDIFMQSFYSGVEKWWSNQSLDPAGIEPLKYALVDWLAAYQAHTAAQNAAQSARQVKDAARAALERQARPITNFIQSYPATTDADRAAIGITIRSTGSRSATAPASKPLVLVSPAQRLTHTLRLVDEATPTRRARPRGVDRAEVFVALTPTAAPAPADPATYRYIGSTTRGETVLSFEPEKGGMQAHYISRWVSTTGAPGPWSETASATVAA